MKVVGIAGESGTGKTTIAEYIASRYGTHVDADGVTHELLAGDDEVKGRIRVRFGDDVFGGDGGVDRRALGQEGQTPSAYGSDGGGPGTDRPAGHLEQTVCL